METGKGRREDGLTGDGENNGVLGASQVRDVGVERHTLSEDVSGQEDRSSGEIGRTKMK